ncbi:MAG TPA: Flp family type IVb pilin [Dehalococcoidia bacterium]|nr:Flp family type IVb pilin [Dehalococcoidia bacterium]
MLETIRSALWWLLAEGEGGQGLTEYGLIIALVVIGAIFALTTLGAVIATNLGAIANAFP